MKTEKQANLNYQRTIARRFLILRIEKAIKNLDLKIKHIQDLIDTYNQVWRYRRK